MGVRLGGGLLKCGTCGKPRGITHTCVTRATSKRRKTRTKLQPRIAATCTECGKRRGIRHTCAPKSDFKSRRREQATAARRKKRKATKQRQAARRKLAKAERMAAAKLLKAATGHKTHPPRKRGDAHEPGTCGDKECPRFGCKSYWAGMADCPGPHGAE
jgi:hypothetical protein